MPKIGLAIIAGNEDRVIARAILSAPNGLAATFVGVNNSTDKTAEIAEFLGANVRHIGWDGFANTRNALLDIMRAEGMEYALCLDCDDVFEVDEGWRADGVILDAYRIPLINGATAYDRVALFRLNKGYRYVGRVHEVLDGAGVPPREPHIRIRCMNDGASWANLRAKYLGHAHLLELEEPTPRTVFYLAQSYRDGGKPEEALRQYERRVAMGGWGEEVFCSLVEIGKLRTGLGQDPTEAYLRAFAYRPTRAEPLTYLAQWHRRRGSPATAFPFALAAKGLPRPDDVLFVDESVYAWQSTDECAVAAFHVGRKELCAQMCRALLGSETLPVSERARVAENLRLSVTTSQ